ncbi:MAG: zinc ribbon domain-containing protein [Candidatus Heimdallarchaeota archaeon]|nr:zinc ribbon domain-containing protein [Candidatus Heimdallarchaeota archaeon]
MNIDYSAKDDSTPVRGLGRAIKIYGYAQIGIFVAGIVLVVILVAQVISIVTSAADPGEPIQELTGIIRTFVVMLIIIGLVSTFYLYRIYQSVRQFTPDNTLLTNDLHRAKKLFLIAIILQIIGAIMAYYLVNILLDDLDQLASTDPTPDDFEQWLTENDFTGATVLSNLFAIVITIAMMISFDALGKWTEEISTKSRTWGFAEAKNKLGTIRIGFIILILGQAFTVINAVGIDRIVPFIGSVVSIVGFIQTGNRLDNLQSVSLQHPTTNLRTQLASSEAYPPPVEEPFQITDPGQKRIYCSICGYANQATASYCNSCGEKLT